MNTLCPPTAPAHAPTPPFSGLPPRYQLGECIGRGGAGSVHAAWDTQLDRPVAIKQVMRRDTGMNGLREAQITAALRHPAFVTVYEAWCDSEQAWLVMERVTGQTLKAHLQQHGPASPAQACAWMLQLAQAMAAAHAQGLVHGDLKPSNLMLQPDEAAPLAQAASTPLRLRVLDLGIARLIDPLATLSQADIASSAGTLAYMAPEQLRGQGASVATDIYALGLVMLSALHGASTDTGSPSLSLAWRRLQGDPGHSVAQAHWPASLNTLLGQLLAADPAQRPATMIQVAGALHGVLASLQAAPAVGTSSPKSSRHRLRRILYGNVTHYMTEQVRFSSVPAHWCHCPGWCHSISRHGQPARPTTRHWSTPCCWRLHRPGCTPS